MDILGGPLFCWPQGDRGRTCSFSQGARTVHTPLCLRGGRQSLRVAQRLHQSGALCASFVPSVSDLGDFQKKAALPAGGALQTTLGLVFRRARNKGMRQSPDRPESGLLPQTLDAPAGIRLLFRLPQLWAPGTQWPVSHSRWAPSSRSLPHCPEP